MARRTFCFALLLSAFSLPLHASEQLSAVIRDLHINGPGTPEAMVARLQAVEDRPGSSAPLEQRRLYHASIAFAAGMERNPQMTPPLEAALAQLEAMAKDEGCRRCKLDVLLARAGGFGPARPSQGGAGLRRHPATGSRCHSRADAAPALPACAPAPLPGPF